MTRRMWLWRDGERYLMHWRLYLCGEPGCRWEGQHCSQACDFCHWHVPYCGCV